MDLIYEIISYGFIQKALVVGILIAISSAVLGIFLVLKKYSMIGDGLSHVGFFAVALALILNQSTLLVSLPIVVIASLLIKYLSSKADLEGDAAIGLISSSSMALAIFFVSITRGMNADINSYLFGSILAINNTELILSIVLSVIVILIAILLYNRLFAITFDEEFAKATGISVNLYNNILLVLTSIIIVLGIKILGSLLISSLIIFPTISALKISKSFKSTIFIAVIISITAVVFGIFLSSIIDIPTGATIVLTNLLIYLILSIYRFVRR